MLNFLGGCWCCSASHAIYCLHWAAGAEEVRVAVCCSRLATNGGESDIYLPSSNRVTLGQNFFSFSHGSGYAAVSLL